MARTYNLRSDADYYNHGDIDQDGPEKPDFDTRDREGYDEPFTFQGEVDDEALERGLPEKDMDGGWFHEIVDEDETFDIQCLECGFQGQTDDVNGGCPQCGGSDTELG